MRSKADIKISLMIWTVVLFLTASPTCAREKLRSIGRVTPRETSVLLLPPLDTTPDAARMLAPRGALVRHREEYEFITRQFKMLGDTMAVKAADSVPRIELLDLSSRTARNLDLLADRTNADWVVSIIVREVRGDSNAGKGIFNVRTSVLLQVWDAQRHKWLANGPYIGQDSGGGSPIFMFKASLDKAVKASLENLLGAYPPMVSVDGEFDLRDYLAGQRDPFVGDPKTPFSGLKAAP